MRLSHAFEVHEGSSLFLESSTPAEYIAAFLYPHGVLPHEPSCFLPNLQVVGGEKREAEHPLNGSFLAGIEGS